MNRILLAALAVPLVAGAAFAQLKPPPESTELNTTLASNSEKEAEGRLAAQGWLVLLDRKDWGRAWETSATAFRGKVALGSWMDAIPKVRDPLGPLVERVPYETAFKTTLQGQPVGEYVTVVFQTKFANRQVAEVVTTVRDTDGRWRVTGYKAE